MTLSEYGTFFLFHPLNKYHLWINALTSHAHSYLIGNPVFTVDNATFLSSGRVRLHLNVAQNDQMRYACIDVCLFVISSIPSRGMRLIGCLAAFEG